MSNVTQNLSDAGQTGNVQTAYVNKRGKFRKAKITLKWASVCRECNSRLEVGQVVWWYGKGMIYGIGCHQRKAA